MLRYEYKSVSVPDGGEKLEVILSVKEGQKIVLKGLASDGLSGYVNILEVEGNRVVEWYSEHTAGYGNFIPLLHELEGPLEIKVGASDIGGGAATLNFTLAYEELE